MRILRVLPRRKSAHLPAFLTCLLALGHGGQQVAAQTLAAAPTSQAAPSPLASAASSGVQVDDSVVATAKGTRFVIGLDKRVDYTVFALSNPNRVIVELGDARMDLPSIGGSQAIGLIKSIRGGVSAPGRQRVIIDVTNPVVIDQNKLVKAPDGSGYQLALDIVPASVPSAGAKTAALDVPPSKLGFQPPVPRPAEAPDHRAARAFKPIIVIDPGHGGHDSGATKFGTIEKDVVLAFAKVLRDKIAATGRYKVLMTRDTDVFVELDERRAFGEKHNASLFIAVHADYASTRASGATIYTLRSGVAESLKRSASEDTSGVLSKDEVKTVRGADGDVSAVKGILADLARREVNVTQKRTSIFARSVVAQMSGTTGMRDDPDKQAAFRVLKTAQFPSVLIELGYVSNRKDSELLNSNAWRSKVAGSITEAVDRYFNNQLARLPL